MRLAFSFVGLLLPLVVYYLGGGDFQRTPALGIAVLLMPFLCAFFYSMATDILFDNLRLRDSGKK